MGRRTLVLVVALALAALSAFAVFNYLSSVEDDIRGDIAEVKVFPTMPEETVATSVLNVPLGMGLDRTT